MRERHCTTLQAIEIINELCAQPTVLDKWSFSEEHCRVTARQLGVFTGIAELKQCAPDPTSLREQLTLPAQIDEAPFLNPMLFLLLSSSFPPLALARCLARARFGSWSSDYRTVFPERQPGQGLQTRWAIRTEATQDLGTVQRLIHFVSGNHGPRLAFGTENISGGASSCHDTVVQCRFPGVCGTNPQITTPHSRHRVSSEKHGTVSSAHH